MRPKTGSHSQENTVLNAYNKKPEATVQPRYNQMPKAQYLVEG